MPGLREHRIVGAASGLAYAAYQARDLDPVAFWFEALGGVLGGAIGGVLPDMIEPAVSSWHRGPAHSLTCGSTLAFYGERVDQWAALVRPGAQAVPRNSHYWGTHLAVGMQPQKTGEISWEWAGGHLVAGILRGLLAGYLSHLVLDLGTKRGLPLLAGSS